MAESGSFDVGPYIREKVECGEFFSPEQSTRVRVLTVLHGARNVERLFRSRYPR
jgi:plasmid stabilization system protein ParE